MSKTLIAMCWRKYLLQSIYKECMDTYLHRCKRGLVGYFYDTGAQFLLKK